MADKKNCWEHMQCGRGPDGQNVPEMGMCPAAVDTSHDGINSGTCAGRFCWAVAGTMCNGKIQGSFAEKRKTCTQCHFYKQVRAEEGSLNIRTKFLRFVQPYSKVSFLHNLKLERIHQGDRFIAQGRIMDTAYIIQEGSCIELVEKKNQLFPVGHRGVGDIVGMISLFTGEPMGFHVEAESDMDVWSIKKADFENIPENNPDLFTFLTELVADRFDRKGPIADRTIGKYLITDILGRGGYSIVYKGIHSELERPVAIKMMRHHLSMQADFQQTFQNEAKIIARLNHENIVNIFDIESRYKTLFIIYGFLEGEPLNDLIDRLKKIPPRLALTYLRQIVSAIAYAGEKGLIHRDLNPFNVIVLPNDRIKLIDFGLACTIGADDFQMDGNFNYLAPELLDGEPADFRSDIFSLGVTAFHMVTGHLPFLSDNQAQLMKMMRKEKIPDPGKIVDNLPENLREFILKACENNPEQRFQTPKEVRDWLGSSRLVKENPLSRADLKNMRTVTFEITRGNEKEFSLLMKEIKLKLDKMNSSIKIISKGHPVIETDKNTLWNKKQMTFQTEKIDIAAQTDIGFKRKTNQDRYAAHSFSDGAVLMALADGLGGEPGGETASGYVMECLKDLTFFHHKNNQAMVSFFKKMDKDLAGLAKKNTALDGMATTLITLTVKDDMAFWVHSGDSRLYHLSGGKLTQITKDQTLARFLIQEGELSTHQAKTHYSSKVLDQCIGCLDLTPETGQFRLEPEDRLILASDGFYRYVKEKTMSLICDQSATGEQAVENLMNLALDAGGYDNITLVIGKIR
ncbi:MAG: protein kinase [Proteobacteria bacterium]|nr:protein kinase [Pseudomonadota bacterium]